MALPNSGQITAAMINVELGRSPTAAFNINGAAERALAGKPSGAISFADFRGKSSEIVVTIPANRNNFILDSLFSAADWASETTKRVVIPAGVELGPGTANWVIATTTTANGQAGSFGGDLILENNGIISGKGGAANGGVGGNAIYTNLPGRSGQRLKIINNGTIRAGGGGGGKGGTGGTGGGGSTTTSGTTREPASGFTKTSTTFWNRQYWPPQSRPGASPGFDNHIKWNNVTIKDGGPSSFSPTLYMTLAHTDGWTYESQDNGTNTGVARSRATTTTTNTNGGAGGAGGNGGVGQGYGQSAANGAAGAAGAVGGTNAGRGGTGGTGGKGGAWGASGSAGGTGSTGANGTRTNGSAGSAGAAAGLAGFYITNNAYAEWIVTGTRQGRAG